MKALIIKVTGDVQGVSYRYFAKGEARKLGLAGWTKNELDGTVTIFVQGDQDKLQEFTEWTREGSPMATVEGVKIKEATVDEPLRRFEVR